MSKIEKLKEKLAKSSNGFTFDEMVTLLTAMGFSFHNCGKHRDQECVLLTKRLRLFYINHIREMN